MKKGEKELDVDFIGDPNGLTKDEEKAISDFINGRKTKNKIEENKRDASNSLKRGKRLPELSE